MEQRTTWAEHHRTWVKRTPATMLGSLMRGMSKHIGLIGPMYRLNRRTEEHGISASWAPRAYKNNVDV